MTTTFVKLTATSNGYYIQKEGQDGCLHNPARGNVLEPVWGPKLETRVFEDRELAVDHAQMQGWQVLPELAMWFAWVKLDTKISTEPAGEGIWRIVRSWNDLFFEFLRQDPKGNLYWDRNRAKALVVDTQTSTDILNTYYQV